MKRSNEYFRGCLIGGAVGDALGAPIEFMSLEKLKEKPIGEHIKSIIKKLNSVGMMIVGTVFNPSELKNEFLDIDHKITQEEFKKIIKHWGFPKFKLNLGNNVT